MAIVEHVTDLPAVPAEEERKSRAPELPDPALFW
ncbi:MAG: hypothetical protein JWP02_2819, partial [Acidimicrobiales bacterium]|nr:hypothetical protein [Acidimicrobiales bacterium]